VEKEFGKVNFGTFLGLPWGWEPLSWFGKKSVVKVKFLNSFLERRIK